MLCTACCTLRNVHRCRSGRIVKICECSGDLRTSDAGRQGGCLGQAATTQSVRWRVPAKCDAAMDGPAAHGQPNSPVLHRIARRARAFSASCACIFCVVHVHFPVRTMRQTASLSAVASALTVGAPACRGHLHWGWAHRASALTREGVARWSRGLGGEDAMERLRIESAEG